MRWLLTHARSVEDAEALRRRGIDAVGIPCVAFSPLPWPEWPLEDGQAVAFLTSPRAAHRYAVHRDADLVAAVSPRTSAVLHADQIEVTISSPGGTEALAAAVVAAWKARGEPTWHFRYPTSAHGARSSEQTRTLETLQKLGPVARVEVYANRVPQELPSQLAREVAHSWSIGVASPSAVTNLFAALPASALAPRHAICFGASTVRAWNKARPSRWPCATLAREPMEAIALLENGQ